MTANNKLHLTVMTLKETSDDPVQDVTLTDSLVELVDRGRLFIQVCSETQMKQM